MCVGVHVHALSVMSASLPGSSVRGISQQEYWSGLPFSPPGDLPDPGIQPKSPALADGFFTTSATWKAQKYTHRRKKFRSTYILRWRNYVWFLLPLFCSSVSSHISITTYNVSDIKASKYLFIKKGK